MLVQQIDAVAELQRAVSLLAKNWVLAIPTMIVSLLGAIVSVIALGATAAAIGASQSAPGTTGANALTGMALGGGLLALVVGIAVFVLGILAQTVVLSASEDAWQGRPVNLGASLSTAVGRLGDVIVFVLVLFAIFVVPGLLCFVFIGIPIVLVVGYLMMYALAAVVIGGTSGTKAPGESFRLTTKNVTPSVIAFVAIVVAAIAAAIINAVCGTVPLANIIVPTVCGGFSSAFAALVSARFYDLLRGGSAVSAQPPPPPYFEPPPSTTF